MAERERCIICGRVVVLGRSGRRLRKGPEGGIRCYDHLGAPTPDGLDPKALEPVPGEDFFWAERRTYEITYEASATATWVGHENDSPRRSDLEPEANPEIMDTLHRELVSVDRFRAIPDTDPPAEFRIDDWRRARREELGLDGGKPGDLPRPEKSLEAFS